MNLLLLSTGLSLNMLPKLRKERDEGSTGLESSSFDHQSSGTIQVLDYPSLCPQQCSHSAIPQHFTGSSVRVLHKLMSHLTF